MALLDVEAVDAGYGDVQALYEVGIHVEEAECVAVVGANGAGKSTLLQVIAGDVPVWHGRIAYDGTDVTRRRASVRAASGLVLVPEGRRLFGSLTAEENLLLGGWTRRPGPWTLDRVFDLFPGLEARRNLRATALSGGEQQACAIGRALLANPRLLLLDEVSLGLAPAIVKQLYERLPRIREEGTTVVVVEQDITQARAAADRVYCLLEGRVSLHGTAGDLSRERITAAYFGT